MARNGYCGRQPEVKRCSKNSLYMQYCEVQQRNTPWAGNTDMSDTKNTDQSG